MPLPHPTAGIAHDGERTRTRSVAAPAPAAPRRRARAEPGSRRRPDELLEAKLSPPEARPGSVSRPGLVNRLRAAGDSPLVAVSAPLGYGKSTVLAQWAARDERPFAWVTLDEGDNDALTLLRYVAAALDRIEPLDPGVQGALDQAHATVWRSAAPRLCAALGARSRTVRPRRRRRAGDRARRRPDACAAGEPHPRRVDARAVRSPPARPAARPPAHGGAALRARLRRPRIQPPGGEPPAPRRGRRPRGARGRRADRPHRGLAGRAVPRSAVDPRRRHAGGVRRRGPLRPRLPPARAPRRSLRRRPPLPYAFVGARDALRSALRRSPAPERLGGDARGPRGAESLRPPARPEPRGLSVQPPVPRGVARRLPGGSRIARSECRAARPTGAKLTGRTRTHSGTRPRPATTTASRGSSAVSRCPPTTKGGS